MSKSRNTALPRIFTLSQDLRYHCGIEGTGARMEQQELFRSGFFMAACCEAFSDSQVKVAVCRHVLPTAGDLCKDQRLGCHDFDKSQPARCIRNFTCRKKPSMLQGGTLSCWAVTFNRSPIACTTPSAPCNHLLALPEGIPVVPIKGVSGKVDFPLLGIGTWQYNSSVAKDRSSCFGFVCRRSDH